MTGGEAPAAENTAEAALLSVVPHPIATWRAVGERVVVERPRPAARGFGGILRRAAYQLTPRRVRLDDIGSLAWSCMDGQRTVAELAACLRDRFGERVEPAEQRVIQFVQQLHHVGLVTLTTDTVPSCPGESPDPRH